MSGGSWVSRSLDVMAVRMADVCDCVAQTTGATPLYIASGNGHVEAVRALVELGAAVNQAKVGLLEVSLVLVVCTHFVVCVLWV